MLDWLKRVAGRPSVKPLYQPAVDPLAEFPGLYQQTFRADQLVVEHSEGIVLIGAAENYPGGGTVHGLLLSWPSDVSDASDICVEFNDQSNSCSAKDVVAIEATTTTLAVTVRPEAKLIAGRVSYVREADMYSGPSEFPDHRLGRIVSHIVVPAETRHGFKEALRQVASVGCNVIDNLE